MLELSLHRFDFPKAPGVAISFHTWSVRQSFIVSLRYQNLVGIGEANPFKPITGDSAEELVEDANKLRHLPIDPKKDGLEQLHSFLQQHSRCKSFHAAIDCAYHDLLGKIQKIPVSALYSSCPCTPDNSVTVFIQDSIEKTAEEAKRIYRDYPHLKILKIKLKGKDDAKRARAIKSVSPARMKFVLDANQGFHDEQDAIKELSKIGDILENVILVEEPCPKGQLAKLKFVKDHLQNMRVFADESASTLEAVKEVVEAEAAHGVNIKLQKAGGIWPARQIASYCQQKDIEVMVGAMIEGPIAIAAGIHFVASIKNAILSDLDTDLELPDFTTGMLPFRQGRRFPSIDAGLGIALDNKKIQFLDQKEEIIKEQFGQLLK